MTPVYSLQDMASPCNPISSTASISFSVAGLQAHSFSLPPFLFYAMKAKTLARLGVTDESVAIDDGFMDVRQSILSDMRSIAKSVHMDIQQRKLNMDNYVSASIQSRLLYRILGENEPNNDALDSTPAIPINASRSGKNVTVPAYLFKRISDLFGGDRPARLHIHSLMIELKNELKAQNLLTPEDVLIGEAQNSTWSRKLHNRLFLELIKISNLAELHTTPSLLNVKMRRDYSIETKVRNGQLSAPAR